MLNITLFSYEQMNNHHWMNGIVPINRNHQILGRFAFLIACDLVAGLEVAVSIACAGTIMHEPVKVTDAIDFAAMTVLTSCCSTPSCSRSCTGSPLIAPWPPLF